jgi:hypothetical protein
MLHLYSNGDFAIAATVRPWGDNIYDLGLDSLRWRNLRLGGFANIGSLQISGTEVIDASRNLKNLFADTSLITSGRFSLSRLPDGASGYLLMGKGSGVDPAYDTIGNAAISIGSESTVDITGGASWTPSRGIYYILNHAYYINGGYWSDKYFTVEVYFQSFSGIDRAPWADISGEGAGYNVQHRATLCVSDGSNIRVLNTATESMRLYYRRVQ